MRTRLDDDALAHLRELVREPDLAGTRYRLVGVAGAGGMGTVYIALDTELDRRVALKVLDLDGTEIAARLALEARVLARLEHPGIVPVHEVGVLADGRAFYTMKLVLGERLDRAVARGTTLAERLRLFLRIADAVAFAHSRGVVHRDLKPANVMVGPFGEVLVLDWGLAKVVGHLEEPVVAGGERAPGQTGAGAVLGTPGFMAPEQEAGESAAADARADVFSLGAILESLLDDGAPAPLRSVAAKAMARLPGDRYPEVEALVRDVTAFLDGGAVSAWHEGLMRRALRVASRHRVALGILGAYLVGRGVIMIFMHH